MKHTPRPTFFLRAPNGVIWTCEPDKDPVGTPAPAAKRSLITRIANAVKTALV